MTKPKLTYREFVAERDRVAAMFTPLEQKAREAFLPICRAVEPLAFPESKTMARLNYADGSKRWVRVPISAYDTDSVLSIGGTLFAKHGSDFHETTLLEIPRTEVFDEVPRLRRSRRVSKAN